MTISYTGNLKLALPITGTEAGTWGDVVNQQITSLLDQSVAGTVSLTSMTNADYTLTNGNGSTANEARYMALLVPSTLTLTAARNIIVPTSSKAYIIRNLSTGGFAVTLKTSGGTGISVPNGKTMALYCDGTNVIDGTDYLASLTLGTALPVLSGGTGVTTSTGTGSVVLNTSPTLITPALGTPASGVVTNLTGTASININGTVGATTPTTGAFTTVSATGPLFVSGTNATVAASMAKLDNSSSVTRLIGFGADVSTNATIRILSARSDGSNGVSYDFTGTGASISGTLSVTGGVTLSGGTANGVAYLNGSKVLTTGSILTYDGSTLGLGGDIQQPNSGYLKGKIVAGVATRLFGLNGSNNLSIGSIDTAIGDMVFVNLTEQMRLTSTGLGIGTSSPGAKLDVAGTFNGTQAVFGNTSGRGLLIGTALNGGVNEGSTVLNARGAGNGQFLFQTDGTTRATITDSGNVGIGITSPAARLDVFKASYVDQYWRTGGVSTYIASDDSQAKSIFGTITAHPLSFYTDGAEKMRLDASGNLGLGVTPSAWASGWRAFQTLGGNSFYSDATISALASNAIYDGAWKYVSTAGAGTYQINRNAHNWFNAPSGTAGNAITFTQAMTLDAGGNLGLGVTPSAWGTAAAYRSLDIGAGSSFVNMGSNTDTRVVSNGYYNGTNWIYKNTAAAVYYKQALGEHSWFNAPSGTAGTAITFTQAMTLDASGNLGIGTSSPGAKLNVVGTAKFGEGVASNTAKLMVNTVSGVAAGVQLFQDGIESWIIQNPTSSTALTFSNSGTERLRLDSAGNLGLGAAPSSWGTFKAVQVQGSALASVVSQDNTLLASNTYFNGTNFIYTASANASAYRMISGVHSWYTAPNGTAGNTVTFTQAMTLNASGNLGLGVTPSAWKSTLIAYESVNGTALTAQTDAPVTTLWANAYDNGTNYIYKVGGYASRYAQVGSQHLWYTAPSGTAGTAITFTQAMTLTAAGELLVNLTGSQASSTSKLRVAATGQITADFKNSGSTTVPVLALWNESTTGDNLFQMFYTEAGGTVRGNITYNRTAGLVSYNTTSDYRAKDIIGPVQNPGAMIDALKVYEGQMKGATQSRPMLIAHEAQAVTPYAVTGDKDAVNEDGTPKHQQMDVSALVPLLLAEIQDLRKRLAAAGI